MTNEYKQGWNLRVMNANASNKEIRPFSGAGSKVKNEEHEDGFRACDSAFMQAVSISIKSGNNPVYPNNI